MSVHPLVGARSRAPKPDERRLLLAALGLLSLSQDDVARIAKAVDWPFVVEYAEHRCALPPLAAYLASAGVLPALSAETRALFDDVVLRNELQNRVLLRDLVDIVRRLDAAGIDSIALKGAALLTLLPPLVRTRHTDDIDLWVQPERLAEAQQILCAAGFIPILEDVPIEHAHQADMLRSPRGTPVELHRYPPSAGSMGWREAWAAAARIDVDGVTISVRTGRELLVDLCVHVALHHVADPQMWPRHMLDCSTLLAAQPKLFDRASAGESPSHRRALWLTRVVLAQARRPAGGPLESRLVFPFRSGWRGVALAHLAAERFRRDPVAFARVFWPSVAHLRANGYTVDRPWKAHWERIRAHVRAVRDP